MTTAAPGSTTWSWAAHAAGRAGLVALLCAALGCASDPEAVAPTPPGPPLVEANPPPAQPIQTDARGYVALPQDAGGAPFQRFTFRLVARFTNPLDRTVYLARGVPDQPRPDHRVLYGRTGFDRSSGFDPLIEGVGHDDQIAVAPGATRVDTFRLTVTEVWGQEAGVVPGPPSVGPMRLAYYAQGCRGDGACPLPDSVAVSNVFTVVLRGGRRQPATRP